MLLVRLLLSGFKTFEDSHFEVSLTHPFTFMAEIFSLYFFIGTAIALAGVFFYSRVKRIKSKPKTA